MTDEQIKQNAEEYAKERCIRYNEQYGTCYDAYIAGAHSRDEEVEELQEELESLRKGFYERGDKLKELMLANNKLRNPWISVKDTLPEKFVDAKGKVYDFSNKVLVKLKEHPNYWYLAEYLHNDKEWICLENNTYVIRDEVTHWMTITV